jgi:putative flippase GtrA
VGAASNVAMYVIYLLLTYFGVGPKLAMTLVFITGASIGFIGNRKWTFAHKGASTRSAYRFVLAYAMAYILNFLSMWVAVDRMGMAHYLVQGVNLVVISALLFVAQKYWIFFDRPVAENGGVMSLSTKIFLYGLYSYSMNIFYLTMELFPPIVRNLVFRLVFKKIGRNCLVDYKTYFRYPSRISLGNNVTINRDCALYASYMVENAGITIGNNVALAPHVRIFTATHD